MNSPEQISCLCVTSKRPHLLFRAINCFKNQTYPNKDLIIIYGDDDKETRELACKMEDDYIKFFEIGTNPKLSLGELRNLSIDKSKGKYVCVWDDDDWYHNQRLEIQIKAIKDSYKKASALMYFIVYDACGGATYLSSPYPWPGSLMFERDLARYHNLPKGEDMGLLLQLTDSQAIYPIIRPELYIYTYHGKNTWDQNHFTNLFSNYQKLSDNATELVESVLNSQLTHTRSSELLSGFELMREFSYMHSLSKNLLKTVKTFDAAK